MSETPRGDSHKHRFWWAIAGDIEAILAAGFLVHVFTTETMLGRQHQDMIEWCYAIGIGAGLALGGFRYGSVFGRGLSWATGTVYGLLVATLILGELISRLTK